MSKLRKLKIGPAIREFQEIDKIRSMAASTRYNYERCLSALLEVTTTQINSIDLRAKHMDGTIESLRRNGRSEVSLNNDRSILRVFATWLQDNQLLSPYQKPCSNFGFRKPEGKIRSEQILKPEHIPACFLAAGERHPKDRAAFALGLYACMRESEILDLRWGNIDLEARTIQFFRRKQRDAHSVPMAPALVQEIQTWRLWMLNKFGRIDENWFVIPARDRCAGGTQIGVKNNSTVKIYPEKQCSELARMCHEIFKTVGRDRDGWGIHTLRRTGACLWYEHTKDIRVVQGILGHSQVKTTETYIQYIDGMSRLIAAAEGFDPLGVGELVTPLTATVTTPSTSTNVLAFRSRRAS